jgi:hypothetical protein
MAQFWIGSTDVNFMLTQIGGWAVGCYNDREARQAVQYAIEHGWVGKRTHYCPDGDTWPAYELTESGLTRVREVYGEKGFEAANRMRQWYRDRVPA